MAAAAQNVGALAAEGDLARQVQRPGRSPWMKLLYKGLRAFINLMPQEFEVNRGVNMMNLDQNDDQLVEFSSAFILARQTEEHIKYRNLEVIMGMFNKDMLPYLDQFIPDLLPKKQWCASDSVLSIYNSASPKEMRSWEEQWAENNYVHETNISGSVWCIRGEWKIEDIVKCLKEALEKDPDVRGDPLRFSDHLTAFTCQNEDKWGR